MAAGGADIGLKGHRAVPSLAVLAGRGASRANVGHDRKGLERLSSVRGTTSGVYDGHRVGHAPCQSGVSSSSILEPPSLFRSENLNKENWLKLFFNGNELYDKPVALITETRLMTESCCSVVNCHAHCKARDQLRVLERRFPPGQFCLHSHLRRLFVFLLNSNDMWNLR